MTAVATPRIFLIDSYGFIFRAYHARAQDAGTAHADYNRSAHGSNTHLP